MKLIQQMEESCLDYPWNVRQIEEELASIHSLIYITGADGRTADAKSEDPPDDPAGYLIALNLSAERAAEILRIGVLEKFRRRGLALVLLRRLETLSDLNEIRLEVSDANRAARTFYLRCGFQEIGRRRRYYRDGSDAVVMKKSL